MNDTSLDCTHKHKIRKMELHQQIWCPVPSVSLHIEFHGFDSRIDSFRVITLWFLVLTQFFRDSMGPFKGKAHRMLA